MARQMTANHQRDFDRLLTRSIRDRVSSGSRTTPTEEDLAATRSQLEAWIDEQARNEEGGRFDWELGRKINATKRRFSADSIASELHNPSWCRDRGCQADACREARRLPRSTATPTGADSTGDAGGAPRTVAAQRVDPNRVWEMQDEDPAPRRWWRSGDR